MMHEDKRVREGEKWIEDSVEGPYQFEESSVSQDLVSLRNGAVTIRSTMDELIDSMSALVFAEASVSVSQFGDFQLALSDAKALFPLYERLMYDPNVRGLPWKLTHVWQVDHTPQGIVEEIIVSHAGIPEDQVHEGLPVQVEDETPRRIDCFVVDNNFVVSTDVQVRKIVVIAASVEECEVFAQANSDFNVQGFVLQKNQ